MDLVEQFSNWQLASGLSPATARRREMTLRRFVPGRDLKVVKAMDVEAWLGSLKVEPQTRGNYLGDIRAFYRWAIEHDIVEIDPTAKLRNPKRPHYKPRPIEVKDLQSAIAAAPERERLMLTLAGYAGLRCAEIASLRLEDIDHEKKTLRITGKGRKTRIVRLHPRVAALVPPGSRGPAVSWHGKPIGPRAVSNRLAEYLHGFGLAATGHMARHTFGTQLYA